MKNSMTSTITIIMIFWISPAMAYIDPGSGSAIMSAIIGFFVAISLAIKTYWYKIKETIFTLCIINYVMLRLIVFLNQRIKSI